MTLGLSICWRGPPGSGKRHALQTQFELWAKSVNQVYVLKRQFWDSPIQGGEDNDEEADDGQSEKGLLPMEASIFHWGFDVSRMSLQDKQYVKSILSKWGRGSQVLATGQRCLVFYHAHLLSSESIIALQAFLEENHRDSVLWLTSEHPLPARLSDWCIEIPVPSKADRALDTLKAAASPEAASNTLLTLEDEILKICQHWLQTPPTLSDVKRIRSIVYSLLHRNIRWTDGFHQWMFALEKLALTQDQRIRLATICTRQPFTGSGQTVPSYRIPILWESYLCSLRDALAPPPVPAAVEGVEKPVKKVRKSKNSNPNTKAGVQE
jgi:hypothetical protein